MTVAELIAKLQEFPKELEVVTEGELWECSINKVELSNCGKFVVIVTN